MLSVSVSCTEAIISTHYDELMKVLGMQIDIDAHVDLIGKVLVSFPAAIHFENGMLIVDKVSQHAMGFLSRIHRVIVIDVVALTGLLVLV